MQLDQFSIPVPADFSLAQAVCSYGFFTQAPNTWSWQQPRNLATMQRRLLGSADNNFGVVLQQSSVDADCMATVVAHLDNPAQQHELQEIKSQVCRMLRLSSSEQQIILKFQKLHSVARSEGFGRLFRSPTGWEDLIKSILLCNCGWARTLAMNKALCDDIGQGAFPSPAMIIQAGTQQLQSQCGLGYRAKTVTCLAEQVAAGDLDLAGLEDPSLAAEDVYQRLLCLPGVGPFTAANMLQLLGHYSRIPCDSETVRHLHKVHKLKSCTMANVQQHAQQVYARYAPYQFLAYWHELWRDYESLVGPFAALDPHYYPLLTGHNMRRFAAEGLDTHRLGSTSQVQQAHLAQQSVPAAVPASCVVTSEQPNKPTLHSAVQVCDLSVPHAPCLQTHISAELHCVTDEAQHMAQDSKVGEYTQSNSSHVHDGCHSSSAYSLQSQPCQQAAQPCSLQEEAQLAAHNGTALPTSASCVTPGAAVDKQSSKTGLHAGVWVPRGCLPPETHRHTAAQANSQGKNRANKGALGVASHKSVRRSLRPRAKAAAMV